MQEHLPSNPIRSCAACRARVPRDRLLRFVRAPEGSDTKVLFDLERRLPGRGLSVGPSPSCLERAVKRGAFQRQWRMGLSPEDLAVLVAQVRAATREALRSYLVALSRRGGLDPVATLDEVRPAEMRVLWERDELSELVAGVAPGAVSGARSAARIKALMSAVSEFTFARAGGIKRRLEPPEACEALERCGGGELWGSAMTRQRRGGAGPIRSASDGRDG